MIRGQMSLLLFAMDFSPRRFYILDCFYMVLSLFFLVVLVIIYSCVSIPMIHLFSISIQKITLEWLLNL